MLSALIAAAALATAAAQDPAQGWLAYARALPPSGKPGQRLTYISARWKNNANPRNSNSFYSPWFGIDTADNLNLLQPVNPWLGNEWCVVTARGVRRRSRSRRWCAAGVFLGLCPSHPFTPYSPPSHAPFEG